MIADRAQRDRIVTRTITGKLPRLPSREDKTPAPNTTQLQKKIKKKCCSITIHSGVEQHFFFGRKSTQTLQLKQRLGKKNSFFLSCNCKNYIVLNDGYGARHCEHIDEFMRANEYFCEAMQGEEIGLRRWFNNDLNQKQKNAIEVAFNHIRKKGWQHFTPGLDDDDFLLDDLNGDLEDNVLPVGFAQSRTKKEVPDQHRQATCG